MSSTAGRSRSTRWTARVDTRRDVRFMPQRLALLVRVGTAGDVYLQQVCARHDRWRVMFLPGPHAGLQFLRPAQDARRVMSLWRGSLVFGVECPKLYGLTVQLHLSRLGELTLLEWTRIDADPVRRRRGW